MIKFYIKRCFTFLCSICLIAGCSSNKNELAPIPDLVSLTVSHSMKGWELYSWPEGNTWKFSFLTGTNRLKSLLEVTSSNAPDVLKRVTGIDSAKMVLNKFPQGETITMIGQGWLRNIWQDQYGNLQLPPQNIIDQLQVIATKKELTLTIAP